MIDRVLTALIYVLVIVIIFVAFLKLILAL